MRGVLPEKDRAGIVEQADDGGIFTREVISESGGVPCGWNAGRRVDVLEPKRYPVLR